MAKLNSQTPRDTPWHGSRGKLLLALLLLAGCGGTERPDYAALGLHEVTGVVRLDGAPLAGAAVVFENENGTFSEAVTDSRGNYRLMYNTEQPGIAPGQKKVRITAQPRQEGEETSSTPDHLPAHYNTDTQLTAEVAPSSNRFDFDLNSGTLPPN